MDVLTLIRGLGPLDARSIGRDSLLRWMLMLPLVVAVSVRLILPLFLDRVDALLHIDLQPFVPLVIGPALLLITPTTFGLVVGFLLLDQRDDGTLTALRVTPVPLVSYLAYRLIVPMLLGVVMTPVAFPLAGLTTIGTGPLVVAALVAAPLGPLMALTLAAFGENKVQGFALMKATSVLVIAPLGALYVPHGWQFAFGMLPTYWPAEVVWSLQAGAPWVWIVAIAGISYQVLLLILLFRRFTIRLSI